MAHGPFHLQSQQCQLSCFHTASLWHWLSPALLFHFSYRIRIITMAHPDNPGKFPHLKFSWLIPPCHALLHIHGFYGIGHGYFWGDMILYTTSIIEPVGRGRWLKYSCLTYQIAEERKGRAVTFLEVILVRSWIPASYMAEYSSVLTLIAPWWSLTIPRIPVEPHWGVLASWSLQINHSRLNFTYIFLMLFLCFFKSELLFQNFISLHLLESEL